MEGKMCFGTRIKEDWVSFLMGIEQTMLIECSTYKILIVTFDRGGFSRHSCCEALLISLLS